MPSAQRRWVICTLAIVMGLMLVPVGAGITLQDTHGEAEPDDIVMTIHLSGDDRAEWTIEHRYRLADDTDRQAFDELAADVEANQSAYVDRFETRMNRTVTDAAAATGRDMSMDNVTVETEVRNLPQEYGIVRYRFDWHGFAVTDGQRIEVGDAIAGLFLDDATSLRVEWAADYEPDSVQPSATEEGDRSVYWRGPTEFSSDQPRLVLTPTGGTTSAPGLGLTGGLLLLIGGLVIALGGGYWYRRRETAESAESAQTTEPDEDASELLSNEEQVLQLIEERGGRMKQQEVVEALGWTDAKTSQVVSTLREEGDLESFRLGRENVLRMPEVDDQDVP